MSKAKEKVFAEEKVPVRTVDPRMAKFLSPNFFKSKSARGECGNNNCTNLRRNGSRFCQGCSDKFKKGE